MDDLHDLVDRVTTESDHLERVLASDSPSPEEITLALSIARRGRRQLTLLVRALAERRDTYSAEAHKETITT